MKSLVAVAAFGALAFSAAAQPALKVLIVDMAKLYDTHYKTVELNAKIAADDQLAQQEVEKMNKEGNALVEEYKTLNEQSGNPALSAEAKTKAQASAQKKLEEIQEKQRTVQQFIQHTRTQLGNRLNNFRSIMLEEISKTASDIAKRRGATLLLDKAGPTGIGISSLIYADPAYDITDEVSKDLNKGAPPAAATPAAAPAAAPAAGGTTGSGAPEVRVPGLPQKK